MSRSIHSQKCVKGKDYPYYTTQSIRQERALFDAAEREAREHKKVSTLRKHRSGAIALPE